MACLTNVHKCWLHIKYTVCHLRMDECCCDCQYKKTCEERCHWVKYTGNCEECKHCMTEVEGGLF